MKNRLYRRPIRTTEGSVAVEMAIVLPVMAMLITSVLWLAEVFWYYEVMQKAAYDAARLLSTATPTEMSTPGPGNTPAPIAQLVRKIVEERTAIMEPVQEVKSIDVQCDFSMCGVTVPTTVRVAIIMRMPFPILETNSLVLTSDVTMRYAGY